MAAESVVSGFPFHSESGPAEHDEPQRHVDDGRGHHAKDEILHRPPERDLGDEHADERAPSDPPAPVEEGPVVHPVLWAGSARCSLGKDPAPVRQTWARGGGAATQIIL